MSNDEHLDYLEKLKTALWKTVEDEASEEMAIVSIIGTIEVLKDEFMEIVRKAK